MKTSVLFSSESVEWETPQVFFDKLDEEFGFTVDVCANKENAKCERFFSQEDNGLEQEWKGICWCNPPYGRDICKWVKKALISSLHGATVVMLLPARTDTSWFHDYILHHADIRWIRGRLKFGKAKSSAPFPSMVVVFHGVES